MALKDITRNGVLAAVEEHDKIGRVKFLNKYGFKAAKKFMLVIDERRYDSKAICGVAHKFDFPKEGALSSDSFSGGTSTVVKRLEALGFPVIVEPATLEVRKEDGTLARSTCEIGRDGDQWFVTLHSSGGKTDSPKALNPGYRLALELLLRRLSKLDATITDALLDSNTKQTMLLTIPQRRLLKSAPLKLDSKIDIDSLASTLTSAAAAIRDTSLSKNGGNPRKRIRIEFTLDQAFSLDEIESHLINRTAVGRPIFVLTWNPTRWHISESQIEADAAITAQGLTVSSQWSTGNRKSDIEPGDTVVLYRQESERGIVAYGVATSYIFQEPHFEYEDEVGNYVKISWRSWVTVEDRLPIEELQKYAPNTFWERLQASGIKVPDDDVPHLHTMLNDWRLDVLDQSKNLGGDEAGVLIDSPEGLPEGAVKSVKVNKYERNPSARKKCIAHHGAVCAVCRIDFGTQYGGVASGYIHVHHVVPISSIKKTYLLDPIKDLVPVCPNCHAVIHHGVKTPRTITEVRSLMGLR